MQNNFIFSENNLILSYKILIFAYYYHLSMNSYRFTLEDYHAVKNADIILDGLTVLAGLNGCGKSTISRWLYGFVRFSNQYDLIVDREIAASIYDRNRQLVEIQRRIAFWTKNNFLPRIHLFNGNLEDEKSSLQDIIEDIVLSLRDMPDEIMARYGKELWDALGIKDDSQDIQKKIDAFVKKEHDFLYNKIEEDDKRKSESSIADLYRIIESQLELNTNGPLNMQLTENGTDLLDHDFEYIVDNDGVKLCDNDGKFLVTERILGRFLAPMGLKRAIYIDTPMAITNKSSQSNRLWDDFGKMLYIPLKEMHPGALRIVREIIMILGGEVLLKDEGTNHKEIRYVRKADGLNIPIDDVATGMKTFAYILRLLQNGYIDSETLLIIDEPEAHLHPQWIVKFAKILVMIQKLLGAKIMVASHDPDMVAAISSMSEAEGLSEVTNFYQATKEPEELGYTYINSGNDISRIFESFNIAIDCIDGYKPIDANNSESA